jgi:lipopolysaccharide export system permease protein
VLSGFLRSNLRFGILQRYVLGEVTRAFGLALLTITAVFVLLTVMTKAASAGLGPLEILKLIPYMIPASLPYTVPVSLLFAATVVYGRLAGDNEVIAVKTAGLSAMVLIWPSILLALVFSLLLNHLSATFIPEANTAGKKVIFKNLEDFFYKKLKMEKYAEFPQWVIKVKDVQGQTMIGPIFKQRAEKHDAPGAFPGPVAVDEQGAYSMVIQSKTAKIIFDYARDNAHVYFEDANLIKVGVERSEANIKDSGIDIPIPGKGAFGQGKMVEEMTVAEMNATKSDYLEKIAMERKRQAVAAAWHIGSGQINRLQLQWNEVNAAFSKYDYWLAECKKFETEIQMRQAMAWGSLFFVILGAPVGILFARRDFLSAFISCFMPIILVYYPLMLFGVNLGKEGIVWPELVWTGNVVLWVAAFIWALPPVRKH